MSAAPERVHAPAAAVPGEELLRLEGVSRRFGEIVAVNDVSMAVRAGEVFGIAGPNGAGKTTLFNVIAGALSGTGHVYLNGADILGKKPHSVCRLGIARTFQIPIIFSTKTVAENVLVGARFGGRWGRERHRVVGDCLEFVGMADSAGERAMHLDLLGKKLVMLAAALATRPSLLLLDEPMGGLAPAEIDVLGELIRRLNHERGMTLIVIEHLIRKLVELSDRLMILHRGEKIALGAPTEVVNDSTVIDLYLGTDGYSCVA